MLLTLVLRIALGLLCSAAPVRAELNTDGIQGTLEGSKLNDVFSRYLATTQVYDPERATRLGLHGSDASLTVRSRERAANQLRSLKLLRSKLAEIQKEALSPDLRTDYELMDGMLAADIYELTELGLLTRRPQHYLEPLFLVYQMLGRDYEAYNARAYNAVARLKQFPAILAQAEANLSRPPEIWTRQAIAQTRGALAGFSEFEPLFAEYARSGPALKLRFDEAAAGVRTALARYLEYLEKDLLPRSDGDFRLGDSAYGFYVERLNAAMKPGDVYSYSKKAYKQSFQELDKEAFSVDAVLAKKKGWKEVYAKLSRENPPAGQPLKLLQGEVDRVYRHFEAHNAVELPGLRPLVSRTPAFMEPVLPYVHYVPPFALDEKMNSELLVRASSGGVPGASLEKMIPSGVNSAGAELLAARLVIPGMQLRSYADSLNGSRIRRISRQPVVANGWACYAELLAEEMGYYSFDWSRFLRFYFRALGAGRAYADASLHLKKWTAKEASQFFQDEFLMDKARADAEVLDLSLAPAEAFAGVLGMDRILEMRREYRNARGNSFELGRFHALFLQSGEIPMDRIGQRVLRDKEEK